MAAISEISTSFAIINWILHRIDMINVGFTLEKQISHFLEHGGLTFDTCH